MGDVELRADYDHDGRVSGAQSEYDARAALPGALLVTNADADRRALPPTVTAGPPIALDFTRYTPSSADDEILPLQVVVNTPAVLAGRQLALRVPGINGVRVRLYDDTGRILPVAGSSTPGDHPLPAAAAAGMALLMEARSYPGSPYGHATLFDTTYDPENDDDDESAFQLQLYSTDAAGREVVHDVGQVSVPPVLFLDSGVTAVRMYICDKPETQAALADVQVALRGIPGITLVTVPSDVSGPDTWLQDQFQPGIVVGADGWRHVIVHLPRTRSDFVATHGTQNLAAFVTGHFPAHNVGLMNDFWDRSLSFSAADGTTLTLPFAELVAVGGSMEAVYALMGHLDDVGQSVDHASWQRHRGLPWSQTLAQLRTVLPAVEAAIARVRDHGTAEWQARLDATVRDAEQRLQQLQRAVSLDPSGAVVNIPTGTRTLSLTTDRADELYRRIIQLQGSANYGGNIEVVPPTAGAPLGTLLIGNARIEQTFDHMDPDVRRFLYRQRQPVFEVDTTWLDVGHVDEILTFVPDRNGSKQPFAALRASSGLAKAIVSAALGQFQSGLPMADPDRVRSVPSSVGHRFTERGSSPVTRLMRGKVWQHQHAVPTGQGLPNILEPPRMYQTLARLYDGGDPQDPTTWGYNLHDIHYLPGQGPDRAYPADMTLVEILFADEDNGGNSVADFVESTFLAPIDDAVSRQFGGPRSFPMPVWFDRVASTTAWHDHRWDFTTSAFTPDVVNLQVLNGHLLVPRPNGPRMKPADATAVLQAVLAALPVGATLARGLTSTFFHRHGLDVTTAWVQRQDAVYPPSGPVHEIYDGLTTLAHVAHAFADGFPGLPEDQVGRRILADNPRSFTPDNMLRDGWRKLTLHEGTVDLFEAYIMLVADALGLVVDWVDSWFYHVHFGGIHCGTNVLREPQRGALPAWWTYPAPPRVQLG